MKPPNNLWEFKLLHLALDLLEEEKRRVKVKKKKGKKKERK